MTYVTVACQVTLVGVFALAVAGKVRTRRAYDEFVSSVATMSVLPQPWARRAALAVTSVEVIVVMLLAAPMTTPVGFVASAGLLGIFTWAILGSVRRGQRTPCRCFGASATPLGKVHVVRNLLLLSVSAVGFLSTMTGAASTPEPGGLLISLTCAVITVLVVVRVDDFVVLFGSSSRS